MTLIITELSEFGIAMVADSAVTFEAQLPSGKTVHAVLDGVRKLQLIPYLDAGISMWGLGDIPSARGPVSTDLWIAEFIERHKTIPSLDDFAQSLANDLQAAVGTAKEAAGFHLAGYVDSGGKKLPTLYHVRNVDGDFRNYQFHAFVAGHDYPPQEIAPNQAKITRNGDYGVYAFLSEGIWDALAAVRGEMKLTIPSPSLVGRVRYHAACVRFISDLYDSSGLLRTIGGAVSSLGISPAGKVVHFSG